MNFSKKITYGIRAMIQLAKNWGKENLSLSKISNKEGISKKYLEQIFIKLKEANLIKSKKGKSGGYSLARSPEKINVFEIIEALEGGVTPASCISKKGQFICEKSCRCGIVFLLAEVQEQVVKILKNKKLRELEKLHKNI